MTYFCSTHEALNPMSQPIVGASLFAAGKPRWEDDELTTRDQPILTAYGSHGEAALLSLRAALLAAVGAVELEISYRRKMRVAVVPPAAEYSREADDAEDAEWEDADDDDSPQVELDDSDDPATVVVTIVGEDEEGD
jgi:hypothetical protein